MLGVIIRKRLGTCNDFILRENQRQFKELFANPSTKAFLRVHRLGSITSPSQSVCRSRTWALVDLGLPEVDSILSVQAA